MPSYVHHSSQLDRTSANAKGKQRHERKRNVLVQKEKGTKIEIERER